MKQASKIIAELKKGKYKSIFKTLYIEDVLLNKQKDRYVNALKSIY